MLPFMYQLNLKKKSNKYNLPDGEEDDFDFDDGFFPERDDYEDDGTWREDEDGHFDANRSECSYGFSSPKLCLLG